MEGRMWNAITDHTEKGPVFGVVRPSFHQFDKVIGLHVRLIALARPGRRVIIAGEDRAKVFMPRLKPINDSNLSLSSGGT